MKMRYEKDLFRCDLCRSIKPLAQSADNAGDVCADCGEMPRIWHHWHDTFARLFVALTVAAITMFALAVIVAKVVAR